MPGDEYLSTHLLAEQKNGLALGSKCRAIQQHIQEDVRINKDPSDHHASKPYFSE
jgi:hypothetical protein